MSATNHTQHGLVQYILDDEPMMDDTNSDNLIIEQGLQKIDEHIADQNNPHNTTKEKIGLGNVDDTPDADKPVSTAQQAAINAMGAQKIDKTAIVNNLTDGGENKPLSATQGMILQASKADQPHQLHTQTDGGWHVEDSAGGLAADCVIGGNGWQSKVGKNKLPPFSNLTNGGVTITVSQDGTVTLNGTATGNHFAVVLFPPLLNGVYTLSNNNPVASASGCYTQFRTNGEFNSTNANLAVVNGVGTIEVNDTTRVDGLRIRTAVGAVFDNFIIKPQIELGPATPYEPYTPDPTPEAPIMPVCLPAGAKIKFVGANHININAPPASAPHVTYTVDDNKITVVSDSEKAAAALRFTVDVTPNTTYCLKCKVQQAIAYEPFSSAVDVRDIKDNSRLFSRLLNKNTAEQTITGTFNSGNRNQVWLWLYPRASAVADSPNTTVYTDVMVSLQDIPYEPYTNPTTLITPCDLWATPDGSLKDTWNPLTGAVITQLTNKVFNGTESWELESNRNAFGVVAGGSLSRVPIGNVLCWSDIALGVGWNSLITNATLIAVTRSTNYVYVRPSAILPTLNDWKAQLSASPIKVIYPKADANVAPVQYPPQPITLPKGIVNVIVELPAGGVLPSEMSLFYRQDLKAYIESIVGGLMDTFAAHITSLTVQVAELKTAGGEKT